jgi:hypothetical protein
MASSVQNGGLPRGRKLGVRRFVLQAIYALRKEPYKGIHTVFSGFNRAFKQYYGEEADPRAAVSELVDEGVIVLRPAKGGVIIYDADDAPKSLTQMDRLSTDETLEEILGCEL